MAHWEEDAVMDIYMAVRTGVMTLSEFREWLDAHTTAINDANRNDMQSFYGDLIT